MIGGVQLGEQQLVQLLPDPGLVPGAQPAPGGHPATEAELLRQVLRVYVDHYNSHRPHRALELTPPIPHQRLRPVNSDPTERVHRRDRLGGLIHEYAAAA